MLQQIRKNQKLRRLSFHAMPHHRRSIFHLIRVDERPEVQARAGSREFDRTRRGKGDFVTVLEDVAALIARLSPQAICDDCIAERLDLSVRQHANQKTRELAGTGGFERRRDMCSLCGSGKLVIRKA